MTMNFAGAGVESVTLTNTADGTKHTVITGNVILPLAPNTTYNITMTPNYRFESWSSVSGTLGSTSTMNTTYSTTSNDTLTITGSTGLFMHNMTLSDCQVNVGTNGNAANIGDSIIVYDARISNYSSGDDGSYTARYINGYCWMTQNLRVQGTLPAEYSNFSGSDFNVSQYDSKQTTCGSGYNGYKTVCSHIPDSSDLATIGNSATTQSVGAYYNYCAASAGTICIESYIQNPSSTSDVCPSGWHIPTGAPNNSNSEFYRLFQTTSTNNISSNNYLNAFGAVRVGFIGGQNSLNNYESGYWWSSGLVSTGNRYVLTANSDNTFKGGSSWERYNSMPIRCVKSS